MIRKTLLLLCVPALVALSACKSTAPAAPAVSPVNVGQVAVPEVYQMDQNTYELILPLDRDSGISLADRVVFKRVGGAETVYPVANITEKSFLVQCDKSITSGFYSLFLEHEGRRYFLGQTTIDLRIPVEVTPGPGINLYGIVLCDGVGVPGVVVSDGAETVLTDQDGIYRMNSEKKWKYVFVSVPSGYEPPLQGMLPRFFASLDEKAGRETPERKDFVLTRAANDDFTLFVLGDMHLAARNSDAAQFDLLARDLQQTLSSTAGRKYLLTLGDMTWDVYWYSHNFCFPEYIALTEKYLAGQYVFHTMGNHDNDMNSAGDFLKAFRYTRDICPTYYSFNIGSVHFIVLDDIDFNDTPANTETDEDIRGDYVGNFTAEQLTWLAKDLSYVSKDTPLVISTHSPIFYPTSSLGWKKHMTSTYDPGEGGTDAILAAVAGYDVHFLTGHTHNMFHYRYSPTVMEHNVSAVCGTWWWSGHLTPGVNISQDGSTAGYGILSFKGKEMTYNYKAAGWPLSHQFRAYDMGKVKEVIVPSLGANREKFLTFVNYIQAFDDNDILINVWDYDATWKVEVWQGDTKLPVKQTYTFDPLHIVAMTAKRFQSKESPNFLSERWHHFFVARATARDAAVVIKVTDRNGVEHTETMIRPKPFLVADYTKK